MAIVLPNVQRLELYICLKLIGEHAPLIRGCDTYFSVQLDSYKCRFDLVHIIFLVVSKRGQNNANLPTTMTDLLIGIHRALSLHHNA